MPKKKKKKLTPAQKRARKAHKEKYETIFINGKQVRVKKAPTIDGMPVDEFLRRNADPIWLHQNEMWEFIEPEPPLWEEAWNGEELQEPLEERLPDD